MNRRDRFLGIGFGGGDCKARELQGLCPRPHKDSALDPGSSFRSGVMAALPLVAGQGGSERGGWGLPEGDQGD